ncbi:restriction endonuclease subunit S [Nocardia sp. AG03]|uniref:restriction endonuclease subunit S n=1 Tax=Nocardia sp. AG03 TaxID=3025312 RepID=UPI002418936D|nr:restriction endonuclease subunit S [Nocardia sp. AG03]
MTVARLDKVVTITMGQAPPGESYNNEGNGLPLIAGAGDFTRSGIEVKKYTTNSSKTSVPGDIILGIRASIGDKRVADGKYALGRGVASLRPTELINRRYLWHWLSHVADELAGKGKGATFKQVNRQDIGEMRIDVLPILAQQRIADVLDRVDELRAKRRQSIALLDDLAQSIFLDMFSDPLARAGGSTLADACADIRTGPFGSSVHKEDYVTGGVPLVNPVHIVRGRIRPDMSLSVASDKAIELANFVLRQGDIVMARRGEMGRCAVVTESEEGYLCGTGSLIIRLQLHHRAEFFSAAISQPSVRRYLEDKSLGATLPNLNQGIVSKIPLKIPEAAEQDEFARRLARVNSMIVAQRGNLSDLDILFASLQSRAFAGNLWKDDSKDQEGE